MKKTHLLLTGSLISSLIGVTAASANTLGPKPVTPTDISRGTIFVSPTGSGSTCSKSLPCNIWSATSKAVSGDVVFLRGGTYPVSQVIRIHQSGSATAPIIFESYPDETAILDGSKLARDGVEYFRIYGNFIHIRKMEIKNLPGVGVWIGGNNNILDGLNIHHNGLWGVHVSSPVENFPEGRYGSGNIIRNSISHDNSDAGNFNHPYANGGNADGIAVSTGIDNRVENCLVYGNSDDGLDAWQSTNTYFGYNIVHSNGIAEGDGNGIKAGGPYPSSGTTVEHNLSYSNRSFGITYNTGEKVQLTNNTTWNNKAGGYYFGTRTVLNKNIVGETNINAVAGDGIETDNSWQRSNKVAFISTDTNSPNFLVPVVNGGLEDIGAYAGVKVADPSLLPDLVVTDVSYANGTFIAMVKNQGTTTTPAGTKIRVGYLVDGNLKTWGESTSTLAPGQSIEIGTSGGAYVIPQGTVAVAAFVDKNDDIAEISETNNQLSESMVIDSTTTLLPDLVVTKFSYANGIFTATVKNQGTAATPPGVFFGVGYSVNGVNRTWGTLPGPLAAGQSFEIGTTGGAYVIPNGTHTISAHVDDKNLVKESNDTNNNVSQTITVGAAAPDLVVTKLSYANGIFTATLKNQGTVSTPSDVYFGVGYYVDGINRTWGSLPGPIAAGQSVEIGTTGGKYVIPSGTRTISAYVNDQFKVKESNETNNQLFQTIIVP